MKDIHRKAGLLAASLLFLIATTLPALAQAPDPLPSWNEGAAKRAIVEFVKATTNAGHSGLRAAG